MNCKTCKYYEQLNKSGDGICNCQDFLSQRLMIKMGPDGNFVFRMLAFFSATKDKNLNPCHFIYYENKWELF